ncbi:MAG: hypothetical protein J6Q02_12290 [Lachnospiraceae bacterium]|nr:hypothetical protein [Lachnospiraceae bacterium]
MVQAFVIQAFVVQAFVIQAFVVHAFVIQAFVIQAFVIQAFVLFALEFGAFVNPWRGRARFLPHSIRVLLTCGSNKEANS